jgi:hypothetical protein
LLVVAISWGGRVDGASTQAQQCVRSAPFIWARAPLRGDGRRSSFPGPGNTSAPVHAPISMLLDRSLLALILTSRERDALFGPPRKSDCLLRQRRNS